MEISELILSHHFPIKMCAHRKKKTQSPTAKETETLDSDGLVVNVKTVPSNSADSWISKFRTDTSIVRCAEKSGINVGMIIVLDSAGKQVVCIDALIMYRSKKS